MGVQADARRLAEDVLVAHPPVSCGVGSGTALPWLLCSHSQPATRDRVRKGESLREPRSVRRRQHRDEGRLVQVRPSPRGAVPAEWWLLPRRMSPERIPLRTDGSWLRVVSRELSARGPAGEVPVRRLTFRADRAASWPGMTFELSRVSGPCCLPTSTLVTLLALAGSAYAPLRGHRGDAPN